MRFFYDYGLRVTINTDNRLITDTSITKELWLLHEHMGFTLEEIKQVIMMGFKSAFVPMRERRTLLRRVSQELEELTRAPIQPELADLAEEEVSSSIESPVARARS